MASQTRNAVADLYNTVLDMAWHPTRYGNAAMAEERQAQLNRIMTLQQQGYAQNEKFREFRQQQRAKRYLATVERNKQQWLARGGNINDFYKKQREAIEKDPNFNTMTPEEQNLIVQGLAGGALQTGRGVVVGGEYDKGNDLYNTFSGMNVPQNDFTTGDSGVEAPTVEITGDNAEEAKAKADATANVKKEAQENSFKDVNNTLALSEAQRGFQQQIDQLSNNIKLQTKKLQTAENDIARYSGQNDPVVRYANGQISLDQRNSMPANLQQVQKNRELLLSQINPIQKQIDEYKSLRDQAGARIKQLGGVKGAY